MVDKMNPTGATSHRRVSNSRRMRITSGMMLFLATIAGSVGSVASQRSPSNAMDATDLHRELLNAGAVHRPGGSALTPASKFTASKAFVESVCSGDGDKTECAKVCAGAHDCCGFRHHGTDATCLQEELEGCVNYSSCHVLIQQEDGEIPAAPSQLNEWCSGSDLAACEQACQPVQCCYDDRAADSCLRNQFLQCLDYAPCQNLRTNAQLNTAPDNLDELCNPFMGDGDQCESVCEAEGGCCWDQNLFGGNCLANNFVTCLTYLPCATMLLDDANEVIDAPPENLDELCTIQELLIGDASACEAACAPADCCADPDMETNCFLSDPLACIEYTQCGLLWLLQRGDDLPKPPADIGQTCSVSSIRDDPQPCEAICEVAECCVDRDFQDNCLIGGNALRCREYAPCALMAIIGGDNVVEEPPETLNEVCSMNKVMSQKGRQECKDLCETAACCSARGEENCLRDNVDTCLRWVQGGCWMVGF